MKKILFLFLIIACSYQSKAQQFTFKPADSILFKKPKLDLPKFQWNDSTLLKKDFPLLQSNPLVMLQGMRNDKNAEAFYSRMPMLRLDSDDKMPVAKLGNSNANYTMPIKRYQVVDPLAVRKKPLP